MTHGGPELHLLSHPTIDHFRLHGSARIEFAPVPLGDTARRVFDTTAQTTLVRAFFFLERVVPVAFHLLHHLNVNRARGLLDEMFPTCLSGQWRALSI